MHTKVWDGFIRFFHWALVALIATLYFSAENGFMELHFVAGFSTLALLLARLIWGVIGSDTAKLSSLFHSPINAFKALKSVKSERPGHSAAGSYMVLAFFFLLLLQAISGLMTTDDIMHDGPLVAAVSSDLVELMSGLHHEVFEILLVAIALHIIAIIAYKLRGKALVPAMITGKTTESYKQNVKMKTGWIGFLIFVVIASGILWLWGQPSLSALL